MEVKKTFNLRVVDEVWDAPLHTFTSFLIRTSRGKQHFNEDYGQAYVAKLHYLQETTKNRSNRFNFKHALKKRLPTKSATN